LIFYLTTISVTLTWTGGFIPLFILGSKISFVLSSYREKRYSFPCPVLSGEAAASSIQSLYLFGCAFHPTETIGHLRRLKKLDLYCVQITEEGLEHLLSKSVALEQLEIFKCSNIICLTIPCTLQQLKYLKVEWCEVLQAVEINALLEILHDLRMCIWSIRPAYSIMHVPGFRPSRGMLRALPWPLVARYVFVSTPCIPDYKFWHFSKLHVYRVIDVF
jgi:hypothetical protein